MWMGYNALSWIWMIPMMVIVWGVAIAVAVVAIDAAYARRSNRDAPMEKLRHRLAAGEISRDEFEHIKQLIGG